MCLRLWGGRKVNYQHVNKEENPVQQCREYRWGTLIHQQQFSSF